VSTGPYEFNDKVVFVTGGGTGIGRGIAEAFVRSGATVVVSGRRAGPLEAFCSGHSQRADFVQMDVGVDAERRQAVDRVIERHGRLDVLVNNALSYVGGPLERLRIDQIESMYRVLLVGTVGMTQMALPHLLAARGVVINISSVVGRYVPFPPDSGAVYASAKAGVNQFTRTLAAELGPAGVRVNAIAPGVTATEAAEADANAQLAEAMAKLTPMGRIGQPSDIAAVALFLASDAASWVTGQVIDAAGGFGLAG
jgi:NAD(P)-dependent dehydrogenase (short-subunit alcohol dehydrogenase family)